VLAEDGALARDGKCWRVVRAIDTVDIPLTVEAVLQARLDLLSPAERDVLQKAAVVGETFWDGALRALGAETPEALLVHLCTREFLRLQPTSRFSGFREYAFRHALVRDVAYSMTPGLRRREMHAAVAGWIESRESNSIEDDVLAARHFEAAGARDSGARAYIRAGRRAAKQYNAFEEARRYLQAALGLADALDDDVLRRDAMGHIGQVYARNAQHTEAEQYLRRAIGLAVSTGEAKMEADFSLALGHTLAASGEGEAARALLNRARTIIERTGEPLAMAEFHKDEGLIEFMLNDLPAAVAATERALAIATAHGLDQYISAVCIHNIGDVRLHEGKLDEAAARMTESLRIAEAHGFDKVQQLDRAFLAYIDVLRTRADSGIAQMLQSICYAEKKQWVWAQIQEKQLLALAYRKLGKPQDAAAQLEEVLALSRANGNDVYAKECQEILAELRSPGSDGSAPS
jgi:predicted ATPase